MTHSKRYSKLILTSGIWEKSNKNLIKYHPANHDIPVYSNEMKKFDMWTLPWQALWQLPLHIITAQAVAVGCVWCSWWQFSTFHCRITSLWIIWLRGYRDMDRIDIGIEMWYQYWYRYGKICNDISVPARIITGSQKVSPRYSGGLKKVSPIIEKVSPDWTMVLFQITGNSKLGRNDGNRKTSVSP